MDMDRFQAATKRKSVRVLAFVWTSLFGVLAVVLAVLLVVVSTQIRRSTDAIVRDTESLQASDEFELRLLTYHRLSNLLAVAPSPRAELASMQATLQAEVLGLMADARSFSGGSAEDKVLRDVAGLVDKYFVERQTLEARGLPPDSLIRQVTPSLDKAIGAIESLRGLNRSQVRDSHAEATRLDYLSNYSGFGAAALLLTGLLTLLLGVRRYVLRPLASIHDAIGRFREGDSEARAPESGGRETVEIAHALNEMTAALVRQRQNQLAFLAGVAHDLRNPLAALKMKVQALGREKQEPSEEVGLTLALLNRQIDRLGRMVNDLLDATRIEAGGLQLSPSEVDLRKLAQDIVDLYAPTSPAHQVLLRAPEQPVLVKVDPLRIEQVISNLLSNAIKYSPGGGPVEVGGRDAEAFLLVQDHGVGIPSEETADIFMPFRRRAATQDVAPGAGLGLSVVKRVVAAHGGRIEVESIPQEGSTFRVWLPLADSQARGG